MTALILPCILAVMVAKGHAQKVEATGGGIVKPGDDLVLTYTPKLEDGANWDRCQWFWKDGDRDASCNFDLITDQEVPAGQVVAKIIA